MNFGAAIQEMKDGGRVKRKGWNGEGIFIAIQYSSYSRKPYDTHETLDSQMTQAYIYIDTMGLISKNPEAIKGRVPWLASQTDMLAEDWVSM